MMLGQSHGRPAGWTSITFSTKRMGRGVTITLNRLEKINALNEPLMREFETAMLAA